MASILVNRGKRKPPTDSAPLEMIETTIQLQAAGSVAARDDARRGTSTSWMPPCRCRAGEACRCRRFVTVIDMLSTGLRAQLGSRFAGTVTGGYSSEAAQRIETVAKTVPGMVSALAERLEGGRYIDVDIDERAARYGVTMVDVQLFVSSAIGGATVGETVEGVARYPINIRYPQVPRWPDGTAQVAGLHAEEAATPLGDVADVKVVSGPTMLKTENARPASWIYIDARDRDIVSVVHNLQTAISRSDAETGHQRGVSGQFELLGTIQG
ncbi:efflux RND transporter permease subunit [Shigella flexneri]